jgi:hypothetical protein
MKQDVFISYSDKDRSEVERICTYLENYGIKCFIAFRDIPITAVWAGEITEAVEQCKLMLIIYSENSNNSKQVDREIELCSEADKPMLIFRLTNLDYNKTKKYYLKNINHLNAFPDPKKKYSELLKTIQIIINNDVVKNIEDVKNPQPINNAVIKNRDKKEKLLNRFLIKLGSIRNNRTESKKVANHWFAFWFYIVLGVFMIVYVLLLDQRILP